MLHLSELPACILTAGMLHLSERPACYTCSNDLPACRDAKVSCIPILRQSSKPSFCCCRWDSWQLVRSAGGHCFLNKVDVSQFFLTQCRRRSAFPNVLSADYACYTSMQTSWSRNHIFFRPRCRPAPPQLGDCKTNVSWREYNKQRGEIYKPDIISL